MVSASNNDEAARLASLASYAILDTEAEQEYDDLATLAASLCQTPIALISLVDTTRQWSKSRVGLQEASSVREQSFCSYAIEQQDLFVVRDAACDPRFAQSSLVIGEPQIRFYAGMPLIAPEGHCLGTLCVMDREPRDLTDTQQSALRVLSRQVLAQLQVRRQTEQLKRSLADQRQAELALRESEAKYRATVDRLGEGVFVVDIAHRRFVEANTSILAMLGYTREEFHSLRPFDIVAGETPDMFARNLHEIEQRLVREGRYDIGRRRLRRKDGTEFPVDLRVSSVPNSGPGYHAVVVRDATDQVAYENQLLDYQAKLEEAVATLKVLASTDGLTQLNNRTAFDQRLSEEYARAARYGSELSLAILDIDHFKSFNDAFGHPAGDEALRTLARTLRQRIRSCDFVARYGGEEFAVILPNTDAPGASIIADRCRQAVAEARWDVRPVTVSVGVSTLKRGTADAFELLCQADRALYRSKETGRNRVTAFADLADVLAPAISSS